MYKTFPTNLFNLIAEYVHLMERLISINMNKKTVIEGKFSFNFEILEGLEIFLITFKKFI